MLLHGPVQETTSTAPRALPCFDHITCSHRVRRPQGQAASGGGLRPALTAASPGAPAPSWSIANNCRSTPTSKADRHDLSRSQPLDTEPHTSVGKDALSRVVPTKMTWARRAQTPVLE